MSEAWVLCRKCCEEWPPEAFTQGGVVNGECNACLLDRCGVEVPCVLGCGRSRRVKPRKAPRRVWTCDVCRESASCRRCGSRPKPRAGSGGFHYTRRLCCGCNGTLKHRARLWSSTLDELLALAIEPDGTPWPVALEGRGRGARVWMCWIGSRSAHGIAWTQGNLARAA